MTESIQKVLHVLRCPRSGSTLALEGDRLLSEEGIGYPIRDGIADLLSPKDSATEAPFLDHYADLPPWAYDLWVNNRLFMKLLWGMDLGLVQEALLERLALCPDTLTIDVPCGTASVAGARLYPQRPGSTFLAVDGSMPMLRSARQRCERNGIENVVFVRADICHLPFAAASLGAGYCINGLHAFASPGRGMAELARCMASGAPLIFATVVSGERLFSDMAMKHLMIPKGFFRNSLPLSDYRQMLEGAAIACLDSWQAGALSVIHAERAGESPPGS